MTYVTSTTNDRIAATLNRVDVDGSEIFNVALLSERFEAPIFSQFVVFRGDVRITLDLDSTLEAFSEAECSPLKAIQVFEDGSMDFHTTLNGIPLNISTWNGGVIRAEVPSDSPTSGHMDMLPSQAEMFFNDVEEGEITYRLTIEDKAHFSAPIQLCIVYDRRERGIALAQTWNEQMERWINHHKTCIELGLARFE